MALETITPPVASAPAANCVDSSINFRRVGMSHLRRGNLHFAEPEYKRWLARHRDSTHRPSEAAVFRSSPLWPCAVAFTDRRVFRETAPVPAAWRRCTRRVYAGFGQALEVVFVDRLHFGRC